MMRKLLSIALLSSAACFNWGTRPENFPPAVGPNGAQVSVRVRGEGRDRIGELLAVDSGGVTIRSDRVIQVAWPRVEALDVKGIGDDVDIHSGEEVSPGKLARLKLVSRFPQGIRQLPIKLDSLIADAGRETQRFSDRRVALAEGYRRVGADFPGMGEHWLNVGMLLQNRIDPTRPTLLTYATVDGRPTLLGVGFVVVTHADSAPANAPGWPEEWHEHSGLLSDESGASLEPSRDSPTHVWIMHVWTLLENPAGRLAADNWALPFVRAGVVVPRDVEPLAGRAASLAVGGDAFLRDVLTDAGLRTPQNSAAVDSVIATARARALTELRPAETTTLNETWTQLASALERVIGPGVRAVLGPSSGHGHHGARR